MSHLIMENDLTFSVRSPEWMGLAIVPEGETENERFGKMPECVETHLCPDIRMSRDFIANFDGEQVSASDMGAVMIAADTRNLPVHPGRAIHPRPFVALATPKEGYEILQNSVFFQIAREAFEKLGVAFNVSTAGTLGNLRRFYFSVDLADFKIRVPDGHEMRSFLAFMTSHDGSILATVKDSHIRPVCANTVGAIMRELANFQLSGKHTANGLASFDNLGFALEAFGKGTESISADYERLANIPTDYQASREIAAGYAFSDLIASGKRIPESVTISTQAFNTAEEIAQLSRTGAGNDGSSLYSLYNGATDFWSNGNGAGSMKVGISKRVSRSHFGQAAEHKAAFHRYLVDDTTRETGREIGAKALVNYALAKA